MIFLSRFSFQEEITSSFLSFRFYLIELQIGCQIIQVIEYVRCQNKFFWHYFSLLDVEFVNISILFLMQFESMCIPTQTPTDLCNVYFWEARRPPSWTLLSVWCFLLLEKIDGQLVSFNGIFLGAPFGVK